MSDPSIRKAVVEQLGEGPLWTSELIKRLQSLIDLRSDPTGDSIKAAIWDLAEQKEVDWASDGRIVLLEEARV